jgi:hypothetical protein
MTKLFLVCFAFLALVACSRSVDVTSGAGGGEDAPAASVVAPSCFEPAAPTTCDPATFGATPDCRYRVNGQAFAGTCNAALLCCPR